MARSVISFEYDYYLAYNKADIAVEVIRKECECLEQVLGIDSLLTLFLKGILSLIQTGRGGWEEAEKLLMQVIEASKKTLGELNPSTLTSMSHLATLYRHQGRWEDSARYS